MHSKKQPNVCRSILNSIVLIVFILSIFPLQATADESKTASFINPTKFKQYHVHYEVNADKTYTELNELTITVLTEQGVQLSQQMPIGMPNFALGKSANNRDIEILNAYTLKNNGSHIDAVQSNPQGRIGAVANSVLPAPIIPLLQMKSVEFQNVEVGDNLVVAYKVIQKEPVLPNNVIITQSFPKHAAYDDVEISLSAPASLNLRLENFEIEKGENLSTGNIQKWVWRYQNKNPVDFQPNLSSLDNTPRIHVSTFEDNAAEMMAIDKIAMASPPPVPITKSQRCMPDVPDGLNIYAQQVVNLFWIDGSALDRLVNELNDPSCVFKDGRPMMMALGYGYTLAFSNEHDWSKILARIDDLKKQFPNKAFVALAEVNYWTSYAWNARGSGLASSVTQDGWILFRERLEKAENILLDSKPYASILPLWYEDMIVVQRALNRSPEDMNKTFLEGTKKYRTFYNIYFTMINYFSPKWGGSWETVDNLVNWSVENTKDIDGNSMYARLYWVVSGDLQPGTGLFKDTRASWSKMKKGFKDMMIRYPNSKWNLNNFAQFACMAGDKNTFLTLRRQIGTNVLNDAWSQNLPIELCEIKFSSAKNNVTLDSQPLKTDYSKH